MFTNIFDLLQTPLFNILFLVAVAWSVAIFLERFRIPLIIGELTAGIIIGPAILNIVRPSAEIDLLASLGMFFLMFYAGLESNPTNFHQTLKPSLWVGLLGVLCPFSLGVLATLNFGGTATQAVLIGAAISGTSMVTKLRILCDLKMDKLPICYKMMGASIVDNITLFLIVSIIIKTSAQGFFTLADGLLTTLEVALFFGLTLAIGYLIFPRASKYFQSRRGKGFTFALLMGFLFALLAEAIRLPFIIGAYLAGLFIREEIMSGALFQKMRDRFLAISHGFLGPIFIMSIALEINFNVVSSSLAYIFALFLAAFTGKLIGVYLGGLFSRISRQESLIMGLAMNGRGEIELIIALIGLQLGIINTDQLSILVIVALATTLVAPLALNSIKSAST